MLLPLPCAPPGRPRAAAAVRVAACHLLLPALLLCWPGVAAYSVKWIPWADECATKLGASWRNVNGGSADSSWTLCAGLLNLPSGAGPHWVQGKGVAANCYVVCPTTPCHILGSGEAYGTDGSVDVGISHVDSFLNVFDFPAKRAW
jgi:hypothetical protein